jgi:hypothetical protein
MDYLKIYKNLIYSRKSRVPEDGIYYEKHHIVMKSMGGTNDKENIVSLTAREHFLAHWLLWRIHKNRQTALAFSMMCNPGKSGKRKITSSIGYAEMRESSSLLQKGKNMSDESKKKMSESHKGVKLSKSHKLSMVNAHKGFKHSEETKLKLSKAARGNTNLLGKIMSEEQKLKISKANTGKKHSIEAKEKMRKSKQKKQI